MQVNVSVIATVLDEASSVERLIASLLAQTRRPDEIVVVDGGSTDGTLDVLRRWIERAAGSAVPLRVLSAPGANISQGRNAAIRAASGDVIAATDAGVRLVPEWLAELARPFEAPDGGSVDVVCGFFKSDPQTTFELAMGATVLPALDEVDPATFLPSSRSVAFRRTAWEQVNGYPEGLDYCEDVVFDLALRQAGCRFVFAPAALAHFRPRPDLPSYFRQYYRYARGDGKARLFTRRHAIRYAAYLLGPLAFVLGFWYKRTWLAVAAAGCAYLFRPYRHLAPALRGRRRAEQLRAVQLVPVVRLVGDVAKMVGYPAGVLWRVRHGAPEQSRPIEAVPIRGSVEGSTD